MYEDPFSLITARFNEDDYDDLAMVSSLSDTLQILLASDDQQFIQQTYLTSHHPTSVAKINFNNDQIDDIAVLHCSETINIFLGTSSDLFNRNYLSFSINEEMLNDCAQSIKVADLNNDGKDDPVIADTGTHTVRVLLDMRCNE
ncbi:unnamed protein product [Adineta ricciae]|nr:unnamed protein product [Adineta ricciae]